MARRGGAARWRGGGGAVTGLCLACGGPVPGLRLLKTFLPYNVVSLSPDTALCALSHNSSVVCLSYIALCFWHRQPAGGGPPSPPASTPRRGYVRYITPVGCIFICYPIGRVWILTAVTKV